MTHDEIAATVKVAMDKVETITKNIPKDLNVAIAALIVMCEMVMTLCEVMRPMAEELERLDQIVKQGYVKLEEPK